MQTAESGISSVLKWIQRGQQAALTAYAAALFVFLPLSMKNGYSGLGKHKYTVFLIISAAALTVLLFLYLAQKIAEHKGFRIDINVIDKFVLFYLLMTVVSFIGAKDKEAAFFGAGGWYMGLLSQLLFVGIYFVVSRMWNGTKSLWYLMGAGAFLVFILGILHRFSIDPLGLYADMDLEKRLQFLSTLGQATWYSSFVCTIFPAGLFWFFYSKKTIVRIFAGLFGAVGFSTLVTQNSDSAFFALLLVLLLLFYVAFDGREQMGRFLEVILLMLFSFQTTGLLQSLFKGYAVRLEALSEWASQSIMTGVLLVIFCIIYAWYSIKGFSFPGTETGYKLRRIVLTAFVAAGAVGVLIIAANTAGLLGDYLPEQMQHGGYLYFDDSWGSGRGKTWMFAVHSFAEIPWWRKLIGVGPDCFSSYFYGINEYAVQLYEMWGNDTLTNAHNEWMNAIICYGLVGGIAYLLIFAAGIRTFLKNRFTCPEAVFAALCLISYFGHNLFCYQQVLCTPYAFWILGMGTAMLQRTRIK